MQFRRLDDWGEQFRRICYPRNKEEPTPTLPKGGRPDTHPQPLPKGGGQGTSTYTFRRICYPPEQKETDVRGGSPLPWGGVGGGYQLRRITYPPEQLSAPKGQ